MNSTSIRRLFRRSIWPLPAVALALALALAGCSDSSTRAPEVESFRVTFAGNNELGTDDKPRDFSKDRDNPDVFYIDIEAMRHGAVDETFNGWVTVNVQPERVTCARLLGPDPPAVYLKNGVARSVRVAMWLAYCNVRIVVTEEGFIPGDIGEKTHCNNKIDDDGDGYVDQDDLGCYRLPGHLKTFYPLDRTEGGGSGAAGASDTIYFRCPTIREIQEPVTTGGGQGNESVFKHCRGVSSGATNAWILVTRVGVDGLYVTDYQGVKWDATTKNWSFKPEEIAYDSIFIYNYSTPLNLQEGDCLTQVDGTIEEFYGFTELNKPTWKKGDFAFCAAKARLAGLTTCPTRNEDAETAAGRDCRQKIEQLVNSPVDITKLLIKQGGVDYSVWDQSRMMTEGFEAAIVKLSNVKVFTEARSCDKNGDNNIDFSDDEEKKCSNECGDDKKCIVRETYNRYNQWTVHFDDGLGKEQEVSIVTAGSIQDFDPIKAMQDGEPKVLKSVVGTMRHLIFGRPPWGIEARWPADCTDCVNKK